MIVIGVAIIQQRQAWFARGGRTSAFNGLVRMALEDTGQYWIDHMLPLHFEPGASAKYGYPQRSAKYLRVKQYAARVRSWPKGRWAGALVVNPNYHRSPAPFVFSGDLKDFVLGNARSGNMKPRATATTNVQKVEIKVQYSHPLRPRDAGQITKITADERQELNRFFMRRLVELMRATPTVREQELLLAA